MVALPGNRDERCLSCGILNGKKIAGMAEAAGLQLNPHTWTNGIGFAANLQLMGAIPNCTHCEFPYEPPGWASRSTWKR